MIKKALSILFLLGAGAFLWWAFSPLLFDTDVNDKLPEIVTESGSAINVGESQITESEPADTDSDETESEPDADNPAPDQTVFPITDTPGHPASGSVRVIETPEEKIIRYEEYDGTNGPDLKIYLASDREATEYIDLGDARGNKGNINYGVPFDVDIDDYEYVLTWCEAFGVLFDYAKIN